MKNLLLLILLNVLPVYAIYAQSWGTQINPFGDDAKGIVFIPGSDVGYTVSINGRIVKTTDGGLHWNAQTSGTMKSLYGVAFTSADSGYIVGDSGLVLYTFNGGTTWTTLQAPTHRTLNRIDLYDNGKGIIVGDSGTVFKFNHPVFTPVNLGTFKDLSGVDAVNKDTAYIVLNSEVNASLITTFNGWNSSHYVPVADSVKLNQVLFKNANGWVSGNSGLLMHTSDGGLNWRRINASTNQNLYALLILNDSIMYAAGAGGTVVAYRNDSLWTNQVSGITEAIQGLAFTDEYTVYAAASGGKIIKTCPYVSFRNTYNDTSCISDAILFTNSCRNASSFKWYLDTVYMNDQAELNKVFDTAGTYQLKLYADNGTCSSSLIQSFYVFDKPAKTLGNDTMICSTCSIILTGGDPLSSYEWYRNGEKLIFAGHSITVEDVGEYTVMVTNPAGCSEWDSINISRASGMKETLFLSAAIYPNPSSQQVFMRLNSKAEMTTTINLVNVTGITVYSKKIIVNQGSTEAQIDVSQLAKGVYFMEISSGEEKLVRKLFVQ